MQHGATVRAALEWRALFRAVLHPDLLPRMEMRSGPERDYVVFAKTVPMPSAELREPVYAQASATVASMRAPCGVDIRARFIAYPVTRPADPERHEKRLGCPVSLEASQFEVAFDAAVLLLPLSRRDAQLFGYLTKRAEALHDALPEDVRWIERVRR